MLLACLRSLAPISCSGVGLLVVVRLKFPVPAIERSKKSANGRGEAALFCLSSCIRVLIVSRVFHSTQLKFSFYRARPSSLAAGKICVELFSIVIIIRQWILLTR